MPLRAFAVERVEGVVSCILIAGFFFYFSSIFFVDSSQQKTIFYLCVALPALFILLRGKDFFSYSIFPPLLVLFFIAYLVFSSLWSGLGLASAVQAAKYGLYLFCLMLAVQAVCERFESRRLVDLITVLGGFAVFFYAAFVLFCYDFAGWFAVRGSLQVLTGWGEDNPISSAIILGLPVLVSWECFPKQKKRMQAGLFVVVILGLGLMLFTKSRGPIAALMVTLLLLSCCRRTPADVALMVAVLAVAAVGISSADLLDLIKERVEAPNYRLEIWAGMLDQMSGKWLFGHGFGHRAGIAYGTTTATHSHSSLLEIIRVGGALGGALFIGMLFYVVRESFERKVNVFFVLWLIYGVLCLCTNGRMLLSRPNIEWFAFWLPLLFLLFCDRGVVVLGGDKASRRALGVRSLKYD